MRDLLLSAAHPGQVGCWLLFFCLHLPCHFFSFFCSYLLYLKDPSPSWGGAEGSRRASPPPPMAGGVAVGSVVGGGCAGAPFFHLFLSRWGVGAAWWGATQLRGCPWHRGGLCLSLTVGSCLWRRKTPAVLPINTLPLSTLLPLYFQPCASPPPRGARIRPRCPFPILGTCPSSWGGVEKGSSPLPTQPPSLCSPARARPPRSSQQSPRCVRRRGELGSE